MKAQRVAPERGLGWFQSGWQMFTAAIGAWLLATVIFLALALILSLIPPIGNLVLALISPPLTAGFLLMARSAQEGETVRVGLLFQGLAEPGIRGSLLGLGLVSVIGTVIGGIFLAITGAAGLAGAEPVVGLSPAILLGWLLYFGIMVLVALALFFAVPLVTFTRRGAWPSVQYSLAACLQNLGAVILFFFAYLVLAFLAALPLGLGFLILIPVVMGAIYQAYQEVFPEEAGGRPEQT